MIGVAFIIPVGYNYFSKTDLNILETAESILKILAASSISGADIASLYLDE